MGANGSFEIQIKAIESKWDIMGAMGISGS
jgi:hypothetical protein